MAAWASLSGYLFIKPGGGGLSRLKSRKKQWCVLDESRGQLLYHKCEEDARSKPPVGNIELRGAAITLDLDNQNQFVVIVDNKEVYLTAENHESMMIWLMALQSKRDQFAKLMSVNSDSTSNSANTTTTNTNSNSTTTTTTATATSASSTPASRGVRGGVGPLGTEEQRERVGRAPGRPLRASLPYLFFSSTPPVAAAARGPCPEKAPPFPPPQSVGRQPRVPPLPPSPSAAATSTSSSSSPLSVAAVAAAPPLPPLPDGDEGRRRHRSASVLAYMVYPPKPPAVCSEISAAVASPGPPPLLPKPLPTLSLASTPHPLPFFSSVLCSLRFACVSL